MLHEVDRSIQNLLVAELRAASEGLIADDSQVVIGSFDENAPEPTKEPRVYLYLHDVHENLAVRDQGFEIQRTDDPFEVGKGRRPTRLNLSYMLTVVAESPLVEHQILGEALGVLMRNGTVPERYLSGGLAHLGEQAIALSVGQRDHWAHSDAPKVWQATGQRLRPFVGIVASALFDPFETRTVKLVREALIAVGQGASLEGADRRMDVRSIRLSAAGAVTDLSGRPIADVLVSVLGRSEQTMTDDQGVFLLMNLPAGRHRLRFEKRGLQGQEVEVSAPPRGLASEIVPLAIQLSDASDTERASTARNGDADALVGTLRYSDGRVAAYVPVRVGSRTAVTDELGMYSLPGAAAEGPMLAEVPGQGEPTVRVDRESSTATVKEK